MLISVYDALSILQDALNAENVEDAQDSLDLVNELLGLEDEIEDEEEDEIDDEEDYGCECC